MDKMMENFKNTNFLTELKSSDFSFGNLDLKNQLTDKQMTIPRTKTSKVSTTFKSTEFPHPPPPHVPHPL